VDIPFRRSPAIAKSVLWNDFADAPVRNAAQAKSMPVILTTPAEIDLWLTAEPPEALALQRPIRRAGGSWRKGSGRTEAPPEVRRSTHCKQ
jgi:hypothetical protein